MTEWEGREGGRSKEEGSRGIEKNERNQVNGCRKADQRICEVETEEARLVWSSEGKGSEREEET